MYACVCTYELHMHELHYVCMCINIYYIYARSSIYVLHCPYQAANDVNHIHVVFVIILLYRHEDRYVFVLLSWCPVFLHACN